MTSTTAWISIEVKYHEQRIFSMPQTTTNLTRWRYTVYTINVKKKSSSTEGGSGIFSMTTLDSTVHVLALAPFPFFFFFSLKWRNEICLFILRDTQIKINKTIFVRTRQMQLKKIVKPACCSKITHRNNSHMS